MRILLVRHGEMAGDPFVRMEKMPVEGCLSDAGQQQAEAVAQRLANWRIDGLYASPLGRAMQTAQAIAVKKNLPITTLPWMVEWMPATVTGECPPSTKYEDLMEAASKIRPERAWKTPAGEGTFEIAHRIVPPLLEFLSQQGVEAAHGGYWVSDAAKDRHVAIVAHGGSLNVALAFLLGFPLKPYGVFAWDLTGVAVVEFVQRLDVWYPVLKITNS